MTLKLHPVETLSSGDGQVSLCSKNVIAGCWFQVMEGHLLLWSATSAEREHLVPFQLCAKVAYSKRSLGFLFMVEKSAGDTKATRRVLEAMHELLDKRFSINNYTASVCSVTPMFCMRRSRKGTQVKVTLSVAEIHGAEVENSEELLEKLGPIWTRAQKDRQADQNRSVSMQMLEDWKIKWRD